MLVFMIKCDGKITKHQFFLICFLWYQPSPDVFRWYEGSSKDANIGINISHIVCIIVHGAALSGITEYFSANIML